MKTNLEVSQEVIDLSPVALDVAAAGCKQNANQFDSENVLSEIQGLLLVASREGDQRIQNLEYEQKKT